MKLFTLIVVLGISYLAYSQPVELEKIRQKYNLPALASTLIKEGKVTSNIAGVRKIGDPTLAKVEDPFHLGSCTKAMTATLLAIYVERGLQWNATLSNLFPELKEQMHPLFQNVPLEWLPAMHSGIATRFSSELAQEVWNQKLDPIEGRKLVTKKILSSPPQEIPGTKYIYSNTNYVIVGALLEKISGKSWETMMKEEIFTPLKMTSCGFGSQANPTANPPNAPWPHKLINGIPIAVTPDFFSDNPPTVGPAGTVHCSMEDWAKFIQLHLDGANGKDTAILKASSFTKLHASYPDKTFTFGGWMRKDVQNKYALVYLGSNTMNLAEVWLFPQKNMAAFALTNASDPTSASSKKNPALKATDEVIAGLIQQ